VIAGQDIVFVPKMSFWLVQNPSEPLFGKEGYGEIYGK
jgi:hypothetical protein